MVQYALKVSSDSFFTYANLLYKNYVIAIASIIIAGSFLNLPPVLDKEFKYLDNMKRFFNPTSNENEFNRKLLNYENKSFHLRNELDEEFVKENIYFDGLEVHKKIHPYLEYNELADCMKMILEYYDDCSKYV